MRRLSQAALLGLLFAAVASSAPGCQGGGDSNGAATPTPTTPENRGGQIEITRSTIKSGVPPESVSGEASFFAPPGPFSEDAVWPASGNCSWVTPGPTPQATAIAWRDAGDTLTLRSDSSALEFDRFPTADGGIIYLTRADADPLVTPEDTIFDLELSGSTEPNGLDGKTIESALEMPPKIGLYAPDLTEGPMTITRTALQIGWQGGEETDDVLVTITIAGGPDETVALRCATPDDGFFEIAPALMEALPSGPGVLAVRRQRITVSALSPSTKLVGRAILLEGGAILLP